ncbi:hypothetical protein QFC21_006571 [Naganishia friedmannii]|uniref:Uncharacterized protein n=1 Tax=Naganishia friedmannii TaxID=89922 RepID=A0ACC2V384_9TREE|nr:hypothetical protein QFC21_006571 [Naganishia friedmannii]
MSTTFQPPIYDKSDPKTADAVVEPFHLPKEWKETTDMFSSASTVVAGFAMMSRNSSAAWLAIITALLGLFNQKPLTEKKASGGQQGLSGAVSPSGKSVLGT